MEAKDYLKDIQDIKQMMSQSTQFISLSGLSGILAGIYALVGAYFVNGLIERNKYDVIIIEGYTFIMFLLTAAAVLFLSLLIQGLPIRNHHYKPVLNLYPHSFLKVEISFQMP